MKLSHLLKTESKNLLSTPVHNHKSLPALPKTNFETNPQDPVGFKTYEQLPVIQYIPFYDRLNIKDSYEKLPGYKPKQNLKSESLNMLLKQVPSSLSIFKD